MRFGVAVGLTAVSVAALAANVMSAAERPAGDGVIDICHVWAIPKSVVGQHVAIKGRVHSDIEASWIYGDACPDTIVRLTSGPGGPSLVDCIAGASDRRCGGLRGNEQLVVVTGLLKMKNSGRKTVHGLPVAAAEVQVFAFELVKLSSL